MQADRRRGRDAQYDDGSSALVRRRTGQRIDDVPLVERHSEIDAIEDAIERGGRADGQLLIVEGPSGIGKSRLLAAARIIAAQKGAEVLTTCGGELEREFPFGLVRRLLEARAVRAPQAERESLIRGHAALAGSLLGPSPAPDESPLADEFHLIHSLYWFVANLADESHLVLIADDLQWADDLSLRFLLYLAQRLADLRVTIIGAVRTGDPAAETELVARLLLQADRSLRPAELTVAGVRKLFMTVLPDVAENATVVAESWTATGGNPFLLNQLATAMSAGAGEGKHDLAGHVADTAPESVGRSVMLRLSRLGEEAVGVARAVSVLGTSASLIAAAELAGLDFAAASAAAGKLRAMQIFSDASDLTFYHPMIRSAVYNRYPADERAQAHLRAAELLRASDGEAERVAVHLMRGAPATHDWARSALHEAARDAGRKGAPATAAGYLRRALLIPRPDRREDARLLVDLGIMEAAAGEETALAHLGKALALIDEAGERDRAMYALGQTLFRYGRAAEARTVFRRGADASAGDPDTMLRFEAGFMASAAYLVGRAHEAHERVAALTAGFLDSEQLSASERLLVLHLAVFRAMSVPGSGEHAKLALRALGDGVQLWRATSEMAPAAVGGAEPCAAPQFFDFSVLEPEVSELGSRTWWVRGQNFALAYTVAQPGEVLSRHAQPDEYVVLFARDPAEAVFCARGERAEVDAASLVVVPPGPSTIEIVRESHVVRLFSAASPELLEKCRNHEAYTEPHANVAPFEAWPDPVGGYRLRVYPIADYPYQQGRFARVFRCSTFMVNVFDPDRGPRDPARLSPHSHDDFEQCSLAVDGEYVHHVRTPWTPDLSTWRADEHARAGSPSVAIIPPPSVHTSQSVSQARNQLVDIFCPPRADFSAQPGWVINEAEYPVPFEAAR